MRFGTLESHRKRIPQHCIKFRIIPDFSAGIFTEWYVSDEKTFLMPVGLEPAREQIREFDTVVKLHRPSLPKQRGSARPIGP